MEKIKIPFDLKICKLSGYDWIRRDKKLLAWQLYTKQGDPRRGKQNRLFIVFDNSSTSSTAFLQHNEIVMLKEVLEMLKNPEQYWFEMYYEEVKVWVCVILIPEGAYIPLTNGGQAKIGKFDETKAIFEHKFLERMCIVSDGAILPHNNPTDKDIDGYIFLPKSLLEAVG